MAAGVLNRCRWMQRAWPLRPGHRVAFRTAPCFVDSIWEVFGPLLAGVQLLPVPQRAVPSAQQVGAGQLLLGGRWCS